MNRIGSKLSTSNAISAELQAAYMKNSLRETSIKKINMNMTSIRNRYRETENLSVLAEVVELMDKANAILCEEVE